MNKTPYVEASMDRWISKTGNTRLETKINQIIQEEDTPDHAWQKISHSILNNEIQFSEHLSIYHFVFKNWAISKYGPYPAWMPSKSELKNSNLSKMLKKKGMNSYHEFFQWSTENREIFWNDYIQEAEIQFQNPPKKIFTNPKQLNDPGYLQNAKLNIAKSCFLAPKGQTAVLYQAEGGALKKFTYNQLNRYSNQVANSLINAGFKKGDLIAIDMVMTLESIAIYLGIVKSGCAVISIADSFAPEEIKIRLQISQAKGIFTQDIIARGNKELPLYEKIIAAQAPKAIVLPAKGELKIPLREGDLSWKDFLIKGEDFNEVICNPNDVTNILFSSGTTGTPKAIPWTHSTPLKCGLDGYYHHDIQKKDVVAWPTNLGWMMGPWLIYATLLNQGTIALYYGAPLGREFGKFVENAKINMLGLVPSIVKAWRNTQCMNGLNWSQIKCFSSTGECSNAEDYLFLMSLANYRPVIEYCGGTEIGGGYITGTLLQPASPATFTTPALGLDFYLLDENGKTSEQGEIFIVPPSIGLSTNLLNRNHEEVYYKNTPKGLKGEPLRRHGDQIQKLACGFFRAQGRADDTMNLGGIKISSAEIERVINQVDEVDESVAIAVSQEGGGPSLLVIYAVLNKEVSNLNDLQSQMQFRIKNDLNPLFKIQDLKIIDKLPRTASNKVMRRVLRAQFQGSS